MGKPNILLITTDQQRFDTINALGNQSSELAGGSGNYIHPLLFRQPDLHACPGNDNDWEAWLHYRFGWKQRTH